MKNFTLKLKALLAYPVVILLFGIVGGFFVFNLVLPTKVFSETENRYLSQMPSFSLKAMADSSSRGFAQLFEKYANDQFALRDSWISLKSRSEAVLFKVENNDIVYGEDNYLFNKYKTFDQERLNRNVSLLADFSALNPTANKYLMVVPASYNILQEKVPKGLNNINQLLEIEKVYTQAQQSGYTTIDVATKLADYKNEYIYYRTDHHWTTQGAYYGYEQFCNIADIPVANFNKYSLLEIEGFFGTYYNKAKNYNAVADTTGWYEIPVDSFVIDGVAKDSMYDYQQLEKRDKYAMFLYGNNGVTVIENSNAPNGTIVVIKDSYANCFTPFLTENYSRVVVIDLRSMSTGLNELIREKNPKDILVLYSFENLSSDANFPRIKY